jgi:4-amino-4-deoxy-L-arabinose transferase-like glycosyltransferase
MSDDLNIDNRKQLDMRPLLGFLVFYSVINFSSEAHLFFDEAQYWTWSKNLDWGYFSKPPMIAWVISATTSVCGDSIGCIKLGAPIMHLGGAWFIYLSAKHLFTDNIAYWSAFTYAAIPGVAAGSLFISADAPLMFFWSASLYFFIRATDSNKLIWWLSLGIFSGLGLMSKYTMIVFHASAFLYLISAPSARHLLKTIKPWISVIISFIIFLPNILWNIENNFISISHTNENVLDSGRFQFHFVDTFEFIGAQLAIFTPILFIFLCSQFPRIKDARSEPNMWLLKCFTFPLLIIAITVSLIAGAQAHWAAPTYVAACMLCCATLLKNKDISRTLNISLFISILIIFIYLSFSTLSSVFNLKKDPNERMIMWANATTNFSELAADYPNAIYVADERKSVALLMHKMRADDGTPAPIVKWNIDQDFDDYYDMTTTMEKLKTHDVLFLTRGQPDGISEHFIHSKIVKSFSFGKHHFNILSLSGFKHE